MPIGKFLTFFMAGACVLLIDAKLEAYFTKIKCENYTPEIITNFTCRLNRISEGQTALYTEFILSQDANNVTAAFILNIRRGKVVANHTSAVVDICFALGALHDNFLFKMIANEIHEVSNYPLHCPFKKNTKHCLNNYTINKRILPSYIPDLHFQVDVTFSIAQRKAFRFANWGRIFRT